MIEVFMIDGMPEAILCLGYSDIDVDFCFRVFHRDNRPVSQFLSVMGEIILGEQMFFLDKTNVFLFSPDNEPVKYLFNYLLHNRVPVHPIMHLDQIAAIRMPGLDIHSLVGQVVQQQHPNGIRFNSILRCLDVLPGDSILDQIELAKKESLALLDEYMKD